MTNAEDRIAYLEELLGKVAIKHHVNIKVVGLPENPTPSAARAWSGVVYWINATIQQYENNHRLVWYDVVVDAVARTILADVRSIQGRNVTSWVIGHPVDDFSVAADAAITNHVGALY